MFLWHCIDNTINSLSVPVGVRIHFRFRFRFHYTSISQHVRALFRRQIYIFIWQSVNDFLVICGPQRLALSKRNCFEWFIIWLALLIAIDVCLVDGNNRSHFDDKFDQKYTHEKNCMRTFSCRHTTNNTNSRKGVCTFSLEFSLWICDVDCNSGPK